MLELINDSTVADTLSSNSSREVGTVTVHERTMNPALLKDERALKVAVRDAMRHLSAVEAMQRLSSCRIFQAGMRLLQIREYLERTAPGTWCKWQKNNGLSRSTCGEAIRLFEAATAKWGDEAPNKLKEFAPTVAKKLLGVYASGVGQRK